MTEDFDLLAGLDMCGELLPFRVRRLADDEGPSLSAARLAGHRGVRRTDRLDLLVGGRLVDRPGQQGYGGHPDVVRGQRPAVAPDVAPGRDEQPQRGLVEVAPEPAAHEAGPFRECAQRGGRLVPEDVDVGVLDPEPVHHDELRHPPTLSRPGASACLTPADPAHPHVSTPPTPPHPPPPPPPPRRTRPSRPRRPGASARLPPADPAHPHVSTPPTRPN